jgi:hypothetical protein
MNEKNCIDLFIVIHFMALYEAIIMPSIKSEKILLLFVRFQVVLGLYDYTQNTGQKR